MSYTVSTIAPHAAGFSLAQARLGAETTTFADRDRVHASLAQVPAGQRGQHSGQCVPVSASGGRGAGHVLGSAASLSPTSSTVAASLNRSQAHPDWQAQAQAVVQAGAQTGTDSLQVAASLANGIDAGYPLTKTGRKKRGTDDDPDEHEGYAVDPPEDSKHPYKSKSYHIRRAFSLFGDIHGIMNDGIKRRAREAMGNLIDIDCIQQPRDYETFSLMINHLDGLEQDIIRLKRKPKHFRKLVRGIRQAADQGRNNDTANLKRDIASMLTEDGSCVLNAVRKGLRSSSKSDRGFNNDVMGRFLCPITLNWDDPRVRQDIREGKHAIKASKVPRLLYANCECDVDDLEAGLGRNQALLRVVKYIFTGRSSAFSSRPGGKTTRAGNAALAGMKEITPRVVAYSACMLRFAISTEESWSKMDNEFNMEEFYWYVVDIFDDAQEFGRCLLAWWNLQVFGTSTETAGTEVAVDETDFIQLLKEQRAAKRAKLLGDSTNFSANTTERTNPPTTDTRSPSPIMAFNIANSRPLSHHPAGDSTAFENRANSLESLSFEGVDSRENDRSFSAQTLAASPITTTPPTYYQPSRQSVSGNSTMDNTQASGNWMSQSNDPQAVHHTSTGRHYATGSRPLADDSYYTNGDSRVINATSTNPMPTRSITPFQGGSTVTDNNLNAPPNQSDRLLRTPSHPSSHSQAIPTRPSSVFSQVRPHRSSFESFGYEALLQADAFMRLGGSQA